jgi:replicative DNA helicase
MTDNTLLYSPQAEESLIGSALIDSRVLDLVDIEPEAFYLIHNGMIWRALQDLKVRGMTPDFVTVGNALQDAGQLENIGGPAYIAKLMGETPSPMGAENYARIIKDKAARRRVIRIATEMVQTAQDEDSKLDEKLSRSMSDLLVASSVAQGAVHWKHYLSQAYNFVDERHAHPGGVWGIETGFRDYDAMTGGLQLTELLLVAGQAGVGKSILVMQMCQQIANTGTPGALYSLEMLGKSIGVRALSSASGIPSRTLKSGAMTADQWPVFQAAVAVQEQLPIYMSDNDYWTTAGLRADLARLKRQVGIEWFIVDYSYLIADGQGVMNETERTQVIIAALKGICKSLGLAGIVIHSLNKLGELRGSGQVKYDADVVLNVTMPDEMHPENIRCTFEKGRELDEQHKHFDLVRMAGIPKYQPAVITKIELKEWAL